ncbi:hypothetical protein REPUB_Repub08aG0180200 [Reevesia pubescens]
MERQLKLINKPPIKSFQTEHGDILDCIDICKQHAFDHPLLKDHKIQMRPKRIPKEMMGGKSPRFLPNNIRCPPGSVLIKRTTKEDLIMAKKIKALGLKYRTSSRFESTISASNGYVSATAEYTKHNYGAKASMSVWNPSVSPNQCSFANIWIANGPLETVNVIQAGWGVRPSLFSSNYTRLLTLWTADGYKKTGCYDYLCPGFVQVYSPANEPSPAMRSGYFPEDGHDRKSAYFKQMQIWDNQDFVYPDGDSLKVFSDRPQCYDAQTTPDDVASYPLDLFYGGPGKCKL